MFTIDKMTAFLYNSWKRPKIKENGRYAIITIKW